MTALIVMEPETITSDRIFDYLESDTFINNLDNCANGTIVVEYLASLNWITVLIERMKQDPNVANAILIRMSTLSKKACNNTFIHPDDCALSAYWFVMKHCPDNRGALYAESILRETKNLSWGELLINDH